MASLLWTTDMFSTGGSPSTAFHSYNNDTGVWLAYTGWPDAVIGSADASKRQQGAWDGTYWYLIGTDGKLYRMNGGTQVWSSALLSGTTFFGSGNSFQNSWQMASDGRFIYLLLNGNDFRRYDPVGDSLTVLTPPPLSGSTPIAARCFLAFDGVDAIYAKGTAAGTIHKYTISSATWSNPATNAIGGSDNWVGGICLQGKFWYLSQDVGGSVGITVYQYDPGGNAWTTKATLAAGGNLIGSVPYGEDTDGTIRIWRNGTDSIIYNVGTNGWTTGAPSPVDMSVRNGSNWCITRLFSPAYSYFQADGITALGPNFNEGTALIGQTITHQIKVKTPVDRGGGATVAVVSNVQTDAEEAVAVSATAGGSYTSSFVTGALTANQLFDVFIKVTPSSQQTAGLTKNWNLRVT